GSKALYISREESQEDLRASMTELGMTGLDAMELYILDIGKIRLEHRDEELSKNWLDVLRKYIDQRVRVNGFDLVAIDSLAALYSLSHFDHPRRDLFHFFGFLKSLGATAFLISEVFVAAAGYSSIASTVFVRTETTSLPGARRNRAAMEASAPVITTRRPTGRCITKVDLALRSDSFWISAVTEGSSRYAVSPAFARTSFPLREMTRAIAFDSLWPDASSDQNAASRDSARRRRRRATIASRSRVRARSLR